MPLIVLILGQDPKNSRGSYIWECCFRVYADLLLFLLDDILFLSYPVLCDLLTEEDQNVIRLYKNKDHAEVEYTVSPILTDNGVEKEVRDHRKDWPLQKSELSILVDHATGGASIRDGEMELMLHSSRLFYYEQLQTANGQCLMLQAYSSR
ncbi:hypothetical protein HN51_021332 [Arachis hypogaea]